MAEQFSDALRCDPGDLRQAMSIHTQKITDSCRDKDCIEDLRVYLTTGCQATLDTCANARVRCAELITTAIEVEPAAFDRSHYCIDLTFYYRILADATVGATRPAALYGLAVFNKRAMLRCDDTHAHIYRSPAPGTVGPVISANANLPAAVVEVLDPMVLASRVREANLCGSDGPVMIPDGVKALFDEPLVITGGQRQLYVTLGQFSILRLERDAQLIVPVLDYAIPCKECCDAPGMGSEDPCELFSRIPFPDKEFSQGCCDEEGSGPYQTC